MVRSTHEHLFHLLDYMLVFAENVRRSTKMLMIASKILYIVLN